MIKNKNKICTLITLTIIIGFLAFLQSGIAEYSYQISILERNTIYAVAAVPMNLLTSFTGLLLLGQTGFMAIGAYVVAIFTIPAGSRVNVYYINGISPAVANIQLPISVALPPGGLAAVAMAALIGIPVLCLKNNYLVVATLGFSEIIRALIATPMSDTIANGSYGFRSIPGFPNIFAVFVPVTLYITLMMLLINSSHGRAFELIREGEVAVQSIGISLLHYRELSFVISLPFTGMGGGTLAMFMQSIDSKAFQVALAYDTPLTMILGGIGNVTGSMAGAFLVTASGGLLRFFNEPSTIAGVSIPLFRSGFRMVVFSILLIAVVLFYHRGIVGSNEFSQDGLFRLIQGAPDRLEGGRKRPSSAERGGIH